MARIAVVGGGIAGAAAAWFLRGHEVTIVESTGNVGGKLRTSAVAGVDVDEGAEQLLVRRPEAIELATELGLAERLVHPATTHAAVWSRGRLHPLPGRTAMGVPSNLRSLQGVLAPWEVGRAALDLVLAGRAPLEDVSVANYVGGRLGRAVVARLVDPLLGGVYAGRAEQLSLFATMPQLPRVDGSLMRAVATTIVAGTGEPVFATLVGGLQRLADAAVAGSGARVMTGRTVRRLERMDTGLRVVHGATNDEQALDVDAVVIAVPATPAARLLAQVAPAAVSDLAAIDYASVAIVTLALPATQAPALVGSGYLVPAAEGRAVKAVTFTSAKWPHLARADIVVVRASIGRYGDVQELQRDDGELVEVVQEELRRCAGVTAPPVASRVTRWGGGLPQYSVGHLDRVRRIRAAVAAVPGLAVCGAAYDGVGVPACIASARRAADSVGTVRRTMEA